MSWTETNAPAAGEPTDGFWTPTVDQKFRVGTKMEDGFGRVYRYAKNGSTELAAALMTTGEAMDAQAESQTQTAYGSVAIGDTRVTVLLTTANALSNGELQDGQLVVSSSTGLGHSYGIANNTWLSGDTVMSIQLYEPIRVAWAATTVITVVKNPWRDIIVCAATPTAMLTGVPTAVIAASYYGWVQTKGPCAMIVDTGETIVVGCEVGNPATAAVAGAVGVAAITEPVYGRCMWVAAAAAAALIDLQLE